MLKIISDPVGTHHRTQMPVNGEMEAVVYKVVAPSEPPAYIPTHNDLFVTLQLAGRYPFTVQNYVTVPLSVLIQHFEPKERDDKFWSIGETKS